MNVLGLFDGISCGQIALERANIKYDKYFSSEIDKYAIKVTQNNFPNTEQLGCVTKWEKWKLPNIDLIIGGSPCQGFSNAGQGLNFNDERSKLFFYFVDILKYYNPKYFLLENVKMKKEWLDIISNYLNIKPVIINSSLISAQNRIRYYWTNIKNIEQPKNKYIYLKDILEYCDEPPINCSEKPIKLRNIYPSNGQNGNIYSAYGKSPSLMAGIGVIGKGIGSSNAPKIDSPTSLNKWRRLSVIECERLQTLPDNYTNYVSDTQRYKTIGNAWTVDVIKHILLHLL